MVCCRAGSGVRGATGVCWEAAGVEQHSGTTSGGTGRGDGASVGSTYKLVPAMGLEGI